VVETSCWFGVIGFLCLYTGDFFSGVVALDLTSKRRGNRGGLSWDYLAMWAVGSFRASAIGWVAQN